jgi:outer membrane lipoprotein SlyB
MRAVFVALGAVFALAGCVPGHTHDPSEANQPYPVTFHAGYVVSVQNAAIGFPAAGVGITGGLVPGVIAGIGAGPGVQPSSGHVGPVVAGVGFGPGIEAPAQALEYTVVLDGSTQVLQITQYPLGDEFMIAQGSRVIIRTVNNTSRVLPAAALPPPFDRLALAGPMDLGSSPPPVLASPPAALNDCFVTGTCHHIQIP